MASLSPSEAESAVRWLDNQGFTRYHHQESSSFSDQIEEWQRGDQLVRLVRDRGQWFMDVARVGWDDWFDLDLAAFVIDTREDAVEGRLGALAEANLDHLLPALREARHKQAEDRLGHLPPRHPYE